MEVSDSLSPYICLISLLIATAMIAVLQTATPPINFKSDLFFLLDLADKRGKTDTQAYARDNSTLKNSMNEKNTHILHIELKKPIKWSLH